MEVSGKDPGCHVCGSEVTLPFQTHGTRVYRRCPRCEARLLHPDHYLPLARERAYYDTHHNNPDDPGYRRFLGKLAKPLLERLPAGAEGLDFGCGPGPALARMLEEQGHRVALYDPVFFPQPETLQGCFDFITCTEVVEHLHNAYAVFEQLVQRLRPGGWLAVMTCFQTDDSRFAGWHYRRDPTHVVFYREETLTWLAQHFGMTLDIPVKDVALFRCAGDRAGLTEYNDTD